MSSGDRRRAGTTGADWAPFLAITLVVLAALPAVLGGFFLLAIVRGVGAFRGAEPPRWLLPLLAAAGLAVPIALGAFLGATPSALYTQYVDAQASLILSVLARVIGRGAEQPWPSLGDYLTGVAPLAIPGALVVAAGLDQMARRRPTLREREPRGVRASRIARRRAERGVNHPADGWALGVNEQGRTVTIADAEARHHIIVTGATGSGKTTLLRGLLDAVATRCPVVLLDCKVGLPLRASVEALPNSLVWTLGGDLRWDALRGDPTCLANKLLAAERYGPEAEIYRAAAARYVQWVGRALELSGDPREPELVADLLQPAGLTRHLRGLRQGATADKAEWLVQRVQAMRDAEKEGVAGFGARFGTLVESIAAPSLGAGPGALVLEQSIREGRVILFSLDAAAYPDLASKIGAWVLLDLVRVAGLLQAADWGGDPARTCYVVIDEFGALGGEGRHVVPLMARTREAGMACVLATQGLSDLARVDRPLPQQVVQNAATRVVLRQGSHEDAQAWALALGQVQREELSRRIENGRDRGDGSTQWRRDFRVQPEDLAVLEPGEAVVQVAPLGRGKARLERMRLARTRPSAQGSAAPAVRKERP